MKTLIVKTKTKNYPIFIGKSILKKFHDYQKKYIKNSNKLLIISTKKIPKKYFKKLIKNIKKENIYTCIFPDGEKIKESSYLIKITNLLSKNNFSRNDCIIALGGGVVGDLSGYAASIFKRGIKFVQVPTTLLSQVDSAVGGKTAINNSYGKNIIGTFYQPNFVLIDTDTLNTLPKREFFSGFAEILKYSLILDKKFFNWLKKNGKSILRNKSKNKNIISVAIYKSCMLKSRIVKKDEFENNYRAILNFGHTFAHAFENLINYDSKKLIHGEAVAIGMACAFKLSTHMNLCSKKEAKRCIELISKFNLPTKLKDIKGIKISSKKLLDKFYLDKKVKNGKITLILSNGIGSALIKNDVNEKTLNKFLNELINE